MYLHEVGSPQDSFTKEDMEAGKHSEASVMAPPVVVPSQHPIVPGAILPSPGTNTRALQSNGGPAEYSWSGGGGGGSVNDKVLSISEWNTTTNTSIPPPVGTINPPPDTFLQRCIPYAQFSFFAAFASK